MRMKKGIRCHDVSAKGLESIVKRCRELDIEYVQLVLDKSIENFEYGKFSKEYAENIKEKLGDMKIAVFGSYVNLSASKPEERKTELYKFKEKIEYASVLKPMVVGSETGFYGDVMSDDANNTEEAYNQLLKNLKELVEVAEKQNVNIGIEGVHCYVINTPRKMARLVSDLSSENVKVIFDPVNYININNYEKQDEMIEEMFALLSDKIVAFHAKDFVVEENKIRNVIPGEGILNYKLIFKKFKEYGVDIPIISEEISDIDAVKAFKNLAELWLH